MRSKAVLLALVAAGLAGTAAAAETPKAAMPGMKPAPAPKSDKALIASAESAAPPAISAKATIAAMGPKGLRVIRKGSNGFTCIPDDPQTPGPDPMCGDENAMTWVQTMMEHKTPDAQKVGFMYMLAGGTDASNTDPYAQKPTKANHWIKTGPHVMVVGNQEMLTHYPASPDPDTKQPYVMWSGTPYAHLMIPVK
ncbi:MAG TPA: hypothetical protein VIE16_11655 [Phenylobacterium sp.]|jgi:hypothetical protein